MRDEDLKNLPQSIEAWRVKEMLEQLGIREWGNVRRMVVLPRSIQVDVLATDADGRRYLVTDEDGRQQAAEHHVTIVLQEPWEKPSADRDCPCSYTAGPVPRHTADCLNMLEE